MEIDTANHAAETIEGLFFIHTMLLGLTVSTSVRIPRYNLRSRRIFDPPPTGSGGPGNGPGSGGGPPHPHPSPSSGGDFFPPTAADTASPSLVLRSEYDQACHSGHCCATPSHGPPPGSVCPLHGPDFASTTALRPNSTGTSTHGSHPLPNFDLPLFPSRFSATPTAITFRVPSPGVETAHEADDRDMGNHSGDEGSNESGDISGGDDEEGDEGEGDNNDDEGEDAGSERDGEGNGEDERENDGHDHWSLRRQYENLGESWEDYLEH